MLSTFAPFTSEQIVCGIYQAYHKWALGLTRPFCIVYVIKKHLPSAENILTLAILAPAKQPSHWNTPSQSHYYYFTTVATCVLWWKVHHQSKSKQKDKSKPVLLILIRSTSSSEILLCAWDNQHTRKLHKHMDYRNCPRSHSNIFNKLSIQSVVVVLHCDDRPRSHTCTYTAPLLCIHSWCHCTACTPRVLDTEDSLVPVSCSWS